MIGSRIQYCVRYPELCSMYGSDGWASDDDAGRVEPTPLRWRNENARSGASRRTAEA